jgi:hypothetical protein
MINWIRQLRGVHGGDTVQVADGPYAGRNGVVTSVDPDGRLRVFIDECCQPVLPAALLKRVRRGRDIGDSVRESRLADADGEMERIRMDSRDMGDGF